MKKADMEKLLADRDRESQVLAELEKRQDVTLPDEIAKLEQAATADPSDTKTLTALRQARDRLGLLSGTIARAKRELDALDKQLTETVQAGITELRAETRKRLEELRVKLESELGVLCGGDQVRTRYAVDAAIKSSELTRWLQQSRNVSNYGSRPDEQGRSFIKVRAAFEAGRTLSEAFAT